MLQTVRDIIGSSILYTNVSHFLKRSKLWLGFARCTVSICGMLTAHSFDYFTRTIFKGYANQGIRFLHNQITKSNQFLKNNAAFEMHVRYITASPEQGIRFDWSPSQWPVRCWHFLCKMRKTLASLTSREAAHDAGSSKEPKTSQEADDRQYGRGVK